MPPRHGKSRMAGIEFPAWFLGRNPTRAGNNVLIWRSAFT